MLNRQLLLLNLHYIRQLIGIITVTIIINDNKRMISNVNLSFDGYNPVIVNISLFIYQITYWQLLG